LPRGRALEREVRETLASLRFRVADPHAAPGSRTGGRNRFEEQTAHPLRRQLLRLRDRSRRHRVGRRAVTVTLVARAAGRVRARAGRAAVDVLPVAARGSERGEREERQQELDGGTEP